jgi:hypothetical protein
MSTTPRRHVMFKSHVPTSKVFRIDASKTLVIKKKMKYCIYFYAYGEILTKIYFLNIGNDDSDTFIWENI